MSSQDINLLRSDDTEAGCPELASVDVTDALGNNQAHLERPH
jgi:hypothetical protein